MNGELAALVALTLHANSWLADPGADAPALESGNSAFTYVRALNFVEPGLRWPHGDRVVAGTAAWPRAQRASGARRVSLVVPRTSRGDLRPAVASAFAGGIVSGIRVSSKTPTFWLSAWNVGDQKDPANRIWEVTLVRTEPLPAQRPVPRVETARRDLLLALAAIQDFAERNALDSWAAWFERARALATSPSPEVPINPDIAPDAVLSLERRQLLAAAFQSWVFGGMGSWNDVWPRDEGQADEMMRVSDALYDALLTALESATNESTA